MKNSSDTIGNRSRDLPVCSAVPQPTAPPRATLQASVIIIIIIIIIVLLYVSLRNFIILASTFYTFSNLFLVRQ
jgi:hypothetical protein